MIQAPADATREELMEVCKVNGIVYHHRNSAKTLREKLDKVAGAIGSAERWARDIVDGISERPQDAMRLNGNFVKSDRPEDVRQAFELFRRYNPGKAAILRRYMVQLEDSLNRMILN